jgi:hypothetical protein
MQAGSRASVAGAWQKARNLGMTISNFLTIGGLLALIAFIVFAFRQGTRVRPSGSSQDSTIGGETDVGSFGEGHGGDGGGH